MRVTNRWFVLSIVALAQFMVVLDATITNVALPSIQSDLHFGSAELQWVINAYTLLFGGFLLLGGRAGDLFGRRRLFVAGQDRKSTRLNSSHDQISYAVFCLKKKNHPHTSGSSR